MSILSLYDESYKREKKAPCQRSHGLRFEPGTAANRTVFKAQGHTDRFKAQPMRALAGGLVHWCQTRKSITCWRQFYSCNRLLFEFWELEINRLRMGHHLTEKDMAHREVFADTEVQFLKEDPNSFFPLLHFHGQVTVTVATDQIEDSSYVVPRKTPVHILNVVIV